jgi:predicted dehydrogenase
MKPLRTAVLGCGGFAQNHVQKILSLPERVELVAFCDRHTDRAQAYADKFLPSAAIYTDHHILLEKGKIDLLVNCLPPYGHSDEVQLAAEHGIHILMEKPVALTSEHAWAMVEAVEKTRIKTQVGFMSRFGAAVERVKSLIDSGQAGQVGLMSARYFCNSLHSPWWRLREKSGGQMVEQIIHMVDLMRYLMGEAATVYSLQNNVFHKDIPDYEVEDVSGTVFGMKSGGIGVVYASNGAIPGKWINDYRLVAKSLTADFSNSNHATLIHTNSEALDVENVISDQDVLRLELIDLLDAIQDDRPARIPMREGALSLDLVLAATRSAGLCLPVEV